MNNKNNNNSVQVVKSVNDELMQATFIVMVPDEVDLHGDTASVEEVRKACHNYNTLCGNSNLYHLQNTDIFSVVESYITPVDFVLQDKLVKAGSWLAVIQSHDTGLWDDIKSGEITGVSIGAQALVEYT